MANDRTERLLIFYQLYSRVMLHNTNIILIPSAHLAFNQAVNVFSLCHRIIEVLCDFSDCKQPRYANGYFFWSAVQPTKRGGPFDELSLSIVENGLINDLRVEVVSYVMLRLQ